MNRIRDLRRSVIVLWAILLVSGCGDSATGPEPRPEIDLDALFRPATAAEIAAVEAQWASRDPRARDVIEHASSPILIGGGLGIVRVFSHDVDGNRHYGATLVPLGASPRSLPVVVFTHGGDAGVNVDDFALLLLLLGERTRNYVFVIPSFRSEPLTVGGSVYNSGGAPSPWDRDVDDALAFLDVALVHVPEADPERIGVLGASRGGAVALLMAIRDSRIDLVSEIAGPTNFLDDWVRGLTEEALDGRPRNLPGIHVLNERFIQPLAAGAVTASDFRLELIRRSPVLWADRLPPVQVHHGTADDVVPVQQAEALIAALQDLDRSAHGDEFFLYPGAGHDILQLVGLDARIFAFLERLRGL